MNEQLVTDFTVENHGTIFVLQPLTGPANEWIEENVDSEPWQWFGGGLCVEHRFIKNLVCGILADGLTVS